MAVRDRVVLLALVVGVLAALATWRIAGPLAATAVGVVGVLVACAAYRIEPSRIDLDHLPLDEEGARQPAPASALEIDQ